MAPPLEVPVDLNPIVKEPPLFTDGPLRPVGYTGDQISSSLGGFGNPSGVTRCAYKASNNELFLMMGETPEIAVMDGFTNTEKRKFSITGFANIAVDIAIDSDGDLVVYDADNRTVGKLNPTTGAVANQFNISANATTPPRAGGVEVDPNSGEILVYQQNAVTGNPHLWRYSGDFVGTLNSEVDFTTLAGTSIESNGFSGVGIIDGNIFVTGSSFDSTNYLMDGLNKDVILATVNLSNPSPGQAEGFTYIPSLNIGVTTDFENSTNHAYAVEIGDEGLAFVGNSDKTLATGKVYSFRIQGPNQTTTPTINDGGQGAKTVQLPGGVVVPLQSLTGNIDVYYDGDTYTVLTLTEGIAQAIYNYQDAVKDNMTATSDPTVNDDTDAGYSVRSRWYNTSTGEAFLAVDVTAGAAVWVKASLTLDELGSAATVESDQNLRTTDAVTHAQLSATQWTLQASYTVAGLPAAGTPARVAYASNGRKAGEGAGAGTGVLVFDDGTNWIAVDTGTTVAA